MRTKIKTVRLPHPLNDAMEEIYEEMGYDSPNALLVGLVRYALLTLKPHVVTSGWAKLPRAEQDALDDALLQLSKNRTPACGTLLERLLSGSRTEGKPADAQGMYERVLNLAKE